MVYRFNILFLVSYRTATWVTNPSWIASMRTFLWTIRVVLVIFSYCVRCHACNYYVKHTIHLWVRALIKLTYLRLVSLFLLRLDRRILVVDAAAIECDNYQFETPFFPDRRLVIAYMSVLYENKSSFCSFTAVMKHALFISSSFL